jgi:hypothetical protein
MRWWWTWIFYKPLWHYVQVRYLQKEGDSYRRRKGQSIQNGVSDVSGWLNENRTLSNIGVFFHSENKRKESLKYESLPKIVLPLDGQTQLKVSFQRSLVFWRQHFSGFMKASLIRAFIYKKAVDYWNPLSALFPRKFVIRKISLESFHQNSAENHFPQKKVLKMDPGS